jgi:hypothetical protein
MSKHFLVNTKIDRLKQQEVEEIHQARAAVLYENRASLDDLAQQVLCEDDTIKCVYDKVIIKVDNNSKDYHTFEDGTKIARLRRFNNLNVRETNPVNAWVIDAENIPKGVEVLVHHNSIHDSNRIFGYKDKSPDIAYYSILINDCFLWRDTDGEWKPIEPYEKALRVFKPYTGTLQNIEPTLIPDTLYVTSGSLKGNIVKTLKACDFEVVFQGANGREQRIVRFRPNGCEKSRREPEAIAILDELNKMLYNGELLVGLTPADAKTIN